MTSSSMPAAIAPASSSTWSGPRSAENRYGRQSWGSGSRSASRCDLLALQRGALSMRNSAASRKRVGLARVQERAGLRGGVVGIAVEPVERAVEAVDDDRAEADPDLVLEAVGGLDQLVDRGLLGQASPASPGSAPDR